MTGVVRRGPITDSALRGAGRAIRDPLGSVSLAVPLGSGQRHLPRRWATTWTVGSRDSLPCLLEGALAALENSGHLRRLSPAQHQSQTLETSNNPEQTL